MVLRILALVLHVALILWCLNDLCALDRSAKIITKAALGYSFGILIAIFTFKLRANKSKNGRNYVEFNVVWVMVLATGLSIIFQTISYDDVGEDDLYPILVHDLMWYVWLIIAIFGYPSLLIIIISFIGRKFPSAGTQLLVVEIETETETETPIVKAEACWAFAFFLINITVFVTWYAFRFSSDGTVNPSWTGVFG
jgi:hypothetical protein